MLASKPMSGLSLQVITLPLRSRKNCVRGNGSCSGSQPASRSSLICSKRLGGLLPAPRAGGDERLTFTGPNLPATSPRRKPRATGRSPGVNCGVIRELCQLARTDARSHGAEFFPGAQTGQRFPSMPGPIEQAARMPPDWPAGIPAPPRRSGARLDSSGAKILSRSWGSDGGGDAKGVNHASPTPWYESGLRPESRAPHPTACRPKQVQKEKIVRSGSDWVPRGCARTFMMRLPDNYNQAPRMSRWPHASLAVGTPYPHAG